MKFKFKLKIEFIELVKKIQSQFNTYAPKELLVKFSFFYNNIFNDINDINDDNDNNDNNDDNDDNN